MLMESDYYKIKFHGDYDRPRLQRHNDFFLMDRVYESTLSIDTILKINRCRMYLNVLTLADISLGDGSTIDPQVYQGRKSEYRYSIHQWPRQARPPRSA